MVHEDVSPPLVTLARGAVFGTLTVNLDAGNAINTMNSDCTMQGAQILSDNPFKNATKTVLTHPLATSWQVFPQFKDSTDTALKGLSKNFIQSMTLTKNVELTAENILGTQFYGNITQGDSSWGGNFTTQFEDLTFNNYVATGEEIQIRLEVINSKNADESIAFDYTKAQFEGNKATGAPDKSPQTMDYNFIAVRDPATDNDGTITVRSDDLTLQGV